MRKIYILVFMASNLVIGAQTINYPQRVANYDATFTDGGGNFDDGTENFGMWANSAAKQSVAFRNFTETGVPGGTATTMAVGDSFTITVSATQASFGVIGLALLSSPSATASWADRINNYAVQVNLNGNGGNNDPWEVVSTAGTINTSSIGGSTSYADFVFKFTLNTATTMNVSINNDTEVFDVTLNNSNITGYSIYISDDWNGVANSNIFWKPTTEYVYATSDTEIPVITYLGNDPVSIEVGETYADAGATASDNVDGDITTSIVVVNPVNTATVGEYTVTYNVSDAAGNAAVQVTRTVNVVDTTVPVITLEGDAVVTIQVNAIYTDDGATATDNYDGDITTSIVVVNPVNTAIVGEYTVTYNVSDAAGNAAVPVTRTVIVEDSSLSSIDGDNETLKVIMYPNPTASKWTIESSRVINNLTLFNLLGQKVLEQTAYEMKVTIDASDLKTGIYMLNINNTTMKRVIKK